MPLLHKTMRIMADSTWIFERLVQLCAEHSSHPSDKFFRRLGGQRTAKKSAPANPNFITPPPYLMEQLV